MDPRRARSLVRIAVLVAAVAVAGGVAFGAYLLARPSVTVTGVVEGPVVEAFYATGTLQPAREYPIRASSAGILDKADANRPYIDKGDHVTAGQALAVVTDGQWQAAYDKAEAELRERQQRAAETTSPVLVELDAKISATQEMLQIATRERDRLTRLLESAGASQSEFDQALNRVKTTEMDLGAFRAQKAAMALQVRRELEVAEAALKNARWNLDLQTLRSPVDGVVLDRPAPLGTRLGLNDHVMQIADVRPEKLVMRAQVDEEDVTKVSPGQVVRMVLYSFAGEPFEGTVTKIYDKADPDRRTFEVDVTPARADSKFAAGMTGELAFEVRSKPKALVVPSQAVQDGKVFLVRNGRLKAIDATVGVRGVEKTELADVQPGDRILISPAAGLKDGQAVRETFMDPVAAAAINKPKAKELFRGGF